jgi:hypothetical protein
MLRPVTILTLVAAASLAAVETDSRARFSHTRVASTGLSVQVSWKESGLQPARVVHNVIMAEARATYVCLEAGQTRAADRQNVDELVSAEGDFASTERGLVSGSLTLAPPGPGMFSCPPGQRLQLACSMYTRLTCKDDTFGISSDLRRTFISFEPGYSQLCDLDLR